MPAVNFSSSFGDDSSNVGFGCLALFAVPFAGAGLFALWQGFEKFSDPNPEEDWWLLLLVGALFAMVGFGLMAFAWHGRAEQTASRKLRERHPGEPWMWKREWASRRISGSNRAVMIFAWVFALFWNLVSLPSLAAGGGDLLDKEPHIVALVLIFPVVGAGLLLWAITATLRYRRFGVSTLELSTLPGVIGGKLAGTVHTALKAPPGQGVSTTLSCTRHYQSGKNSREQLLWEQEGPVPRGRIGRGVEGLFVPVEFLIPYECSPTDETDSRDRIAWKLHVWAELAGVDFESSFEVPVFKTAESSSEVTGETARAETEDEPPSFDNAGEENAPWVRRLTAEGTEFYFRPASEVASAAGLTLFLLIWTAILWLLFKLQAGWFFIGMWGLFESLIAWGAIDAWLGSVRVVIRRGEIALSHRVLGLGSTKRVPSDQVQGVETALSGTGRSSPRPGKSSYVVHLLTADGRRLAASRSIYGKRCAEAYATELRRYAGRAS